MWRLLLPALLSSPSLALTACRSPRSVCRDEACVGATGTNPGWTFKRDGQAIKGGMNTDSLELHWHDFVIRPNHVKSIFIGKQLNSNVTHPLMIARGTSPCFNHKEWIHFVFDEAEQNGSCYSEIITIPRDMAKCQDLKSKSNNEEITKLKPSQLERNTKPNIFQVQGINSNQFIAAVGIVLFGCIVTAALYFEKKKNINLVYVINQ